jgi:exopolyphosphatase / guanosine-5'-triphosphate,3'-diphosphate pyrophosphatase
MPAVAAVDVGSNAIRLSIVQVGHNHVSEGEFQHRYALRLGADVFAHGSLSITTIAALREVFHEIAQHFSKHGVTSYRAIATSAMREAQNGHHVVSELKQLTGINLEIISGEEESRLSRQALSQAVGIMPPRALIVDLGGGSLEVDTGEGLPQGMSLPFGTVRLLEQYPLLLQALGHKALHQTLDKLHQTLANALGGKLDAEDFAIGTGGNFDALARLLPKPHNSHQGIDTSRLLELAEILAKLDAKQRGSRYKLRPDRADLILPAVLVTAALTQLFKLHTFVVPGTGIRQALLNELMRPSTKPV